MKTYLPLLLLLGLLAVRGQYAVSSVHNDCGATCNTNTTCCDGDSFCAGNAISSRCCPNGSGFCGCISNRGFCQGSVFGNNPNISGSDNFGACFDSSTATCTYSASSNIWIVCPKTYTSCEASSFFSCCAPDTVCTTTTADSIPVCTAKNSSSGSGLAVPSQNPQCQSTCNTTNPNYDLCCGCCSDGGQCYGNEISKRCCPANSGFCGCISSRAFCQGSVYNSSTVSGYDNFGACFDTSSGATCSYDPSPNIWIVCPKSYTSCESNSFYTCCDPDSECTTTVADSVPVCKAKNSNPQSDCGPNGCAGGAQCCAGQCYSTGQYQCIVGSNGVSQLCPLGTELCGTACYSPEEYCCQNGALAPASVCTNTPCQPNTCAGGASCCNGQCYSTGQYHCIVGDNGVSQLCPLGLDLCRTACYDPNTYRCNNNGMLEHY